MNHSVAIGNILVHLERSAAAPCWVKGRKCQDLDVVVRLRAKVCGCKRCQKLSASGARTQKCKIDFVDYIIQYHFYCWGIFILFDWLGHVWKKKNVMNPPWSSQTMFRLHNKEISVFISSFWFPSPLFSLNLSGPLVSTQTKIDNRRKTIRGRISGAVPCVISVFWKCYFN